MADDCGKTDGLIAAQMTMFRLAERDYGFSQALIHAETNIGPTSLSEYATGKTKLSLVAYRKLASIPHFPAHLLSLVLGGTGRHVADDSEDAPDLDALAVEASAFTAEYVEAKRDGKVTPIERGKLHSRAERMKAVA